jgi:tetratricopeptide (TPR) repeat protein
VHLVFKAGIEMKRFAVLLCVLVLCYLVVISPFTSYMNKKPLVERLGYVPNAEILKLLSGDQRQFISAALILEAMTYYGGLTGSPVPAEPDYDAIYKLVENAVKLDPYNMDSYYFGQAVLVWDYKKVRAANELLRFGMKYRTWDFYLPFFAGFNYAYFLKDYENAARYYKRVGDLTGSELPINLAGRYMYESGRTDLAIAYLSMMEKGARNEAIKKAFQTRLKAFQEVRKIEQAIKKYRRVTGQYPPSLAILLKGRYLERLPVDPYGGKFYIDAEGKVSSTSRFAFGGNRK